MSYSVKLAPVVYGKVMVLYSLSLVLKFAGETGNAKEFRIKLIKIQVLVYSNLA